MQQGNHQHASGTLSQYRPSEPQTHLFRDDQTNEFTFLLFSEDRLLFFNRSSI